MADLRKADIFKGRDEDSFHARGLVVYRWSRQRDDADDVGAEEC